MGQLFELGFGICFPECGCVLYKSQTEQIIEIGSRVGCLFELVSLSIPSKDVARCAAVVSQNLWHSQLGHVSFSRLHLLVSSVDLGNVDVNKVDCHSGQLAKFHVWLE